METPWIFVAPAGTTIRSAPAFFDGANDQMTFEPGMMGFEALATQLSAVPSRGRTALDYRDGPADPELDEGVQLFEIRPDVVEKLAGLTVDTNARANILANWEDIELPRLAPSLELAPVLDRLIELARQAKSATRSLYVSVLFR